jgi:hypothetical protein
MRRLAAKTLDGTDMRPARRKPLKKRRNYCLGNDAGLKLLDWVRGTVQTSHELASVLERFRGSHDLPMAGLDITDAEEKLWQVDGALLRVERSTMCMSTILGVGRLENSHESH